MAMKESIDHTGNDMIAVRGPAGLGKALGNSPDRARDNSALRFVPLPLGVGWHFVNLNEIVAVQYNGPQKSVVILSHGIELECSEETHTIQRRIEDRAKLMREGNN